MLEATRTREAINAATKEVCETFGIEKLTKAYHLQLAPLAFWTMTAVEKMVLKG